eukprot:5505125-Amphidinium_carterae.1
MMADRKSMLTTRTSLHFQPGAVFVQLPSLGRTPGNALPVVARSISVHSLPSSLAMSCVTQSCVWSG